MGSVQNFFTSRDNNTDPATYVGQLDRLWYNPDTNSIFVSDGSTPGGQPVALATNANILANNLTITQITSTSGNIAVTGNLVISGNISPATETKIGGVKAGPGANISNDGTLTIDTSGLPLSFGDFTANLNILTLVNEDQNMILATQGSAEVQLVGNIGFYKTDGFPPNIANRYASFNDSGLVQILVTATDGAGAVQIIGSTTGNVIEPGTPGTLLHLTGQVDIPCRSYYDGNSNYVSWVARRWNGNVAAPTQVLAGQDVLRINATAATNAGVGNVAFVQISAMALEDQTTTAQGSELSFIVTPVGQPATNRVEVANVTVANGVTATKFTTTGNVAGNNFVATGSITSNSPTAGIGYRTGAGGTVTQLTSKATPVTLNAVTGEIVTNNATLSGGASVTFTLNNSAIANTDVMIINQVSATNISDYNYFPICNTGSANITIVNRSNQTRSDAITLRYTVIKGATA
jgi:hypothetical protein